MILKICLISALVVAFEASPFGGQEDLEVDGVRIQAAASAPAASPQMDVWRAEERQVRRHDCCELDHGSCSLKVGYSNCKMYVFYKCRISKSRSRCVLKKMTKKEKADECCILSRNDQREYECNHCHPDYKCSLSENPNPRSMEQRYMCVPEKMTEKEIAEREWGKTCCKAWNGCDYQYRSYPLRTKNEIDCDKRKCTGPEEGVCLAVLKEDFYN